MLRLFRTTALWVLLLPYAFLFVGAASNQAALNANNDLMPVRINTLKAVEWFGSPIPLGKKVADGRPHIVVYPDGLVQFDDIHCMMSSDTKLNWLSDIFDFHSRIESIGDLFIEFGNWLQTFCPFVWIAVVAGKLRRP